MGKKKGWMKGYIVCQMCCGENKGLGKLEDVLRFFLKKFFSFILLNV